MKVLSKIPQNNNVIKVISVIVACFLWLYVMNEQNPSINYTYTVPLEKRNLSNNFVALDAPSTVRVKIKGPRNSFADISVRDIKAYVDLSDAEKGTLAKSVLASVPGNVQIVEVLPETVSVSIDSFASKSVPVTIRMSGTMPEFMEVSKTKLDQTHVLVYGPASYVSNVAKIDGIFNVDVSMRGEVATDLQLVAVDKAAHQVDRVTIEPSVVRLDASFTEKTIKKVVPVKLNTVGVLSSGVSLVSITVTPQTVEVSGKASLINTINEITLTEINIEGLQRDSIRKVPLRLPEGVMASPALVDVNIKVSTN